jgi:hypothetical protein
MLTNRAPKAIIRNGRFVNQTPKTLSFHKGLTNLSQVVLLQHMYRPFAVVYGFRCDLDNRFYVGSSVTPGLRFHNHLVSHANSNATLQSAFNTHGLDHFTFTAQARCVVFEKHKWEGRTYEEMKTFITQREQFIMDQFPKQQLYNTNRAVAKSK